MAKVRPRVERTERWGNRTHFWIEYPSGLVDLSETHFDAQLAKEAPTPVPEGLVDISVEGDRVVRIDPERAAVVVVDMQKNWGIAPAELETLPPSLLRGFSRSSRGGFGTDMGNNHGRLLMRGEWNAQLYGPLQEAYEEGRDKGTDVWIHKNRISGLWGPGGPCEVFLQEKGIRTLLFAGVNADQCINGTLVDASFKVCLGDS
ncbi:hypothetical protein AURDEDRAFT_50090 [Auricularia subglabra TFB-10046 SS5]|nr:hypothetical protein AURDEDRAFT_50090 [Auricularia subglabra TFB-10046 SS5]